MKTRLLLFFILGTGLFGCGDDPGTEPDISLQFEKSGQTIPEDEATATLLTLTFSRPASASGTVELEIDPETQARVQTTPVHANGLISIPFTKGTSQMQFSVKAIDNATADGDVIVTIRIKPSSRFGTGEQSELKLNLQDDDDDIVSSVADFTGQDATITENKEEAVIYIIQLSAPVAIDSELEVMITSSSTSTFVTEPAIESGRIKLTAPAGTTGLSFSLAPTNNAAVNGHTDVTFSIHSVTGSIVKGTDLSRNLVIKDDELTNKLRSYETVGKGDSEKRSYEYDVKGRIAKVNWEISTGYAGTDTYFYDEQDRLVKINKHPGRDVHYLWSNGRIERMESYQDNVLKEYATYAYDDHGNVAGVEPYHRQGDGSFKKGLYIVYLYFTDGNVYKAMIFQDVEGQEEPVLLSTRTYENYLSNEAVISMFEAIPTVKSQKNLAGSYRLETNGSDSSYWLTYEFNEEGLPIKRTASSPADTQTTVYHYY